MDRSLPGSSVRGDFSGKNAGVGCHFLLQGTFLDQGSNPRLLHWQADSLPLSQQGSQGVEQKSWLRSSVIYQNRRQALGGREWAREAGAGRAEGSERPVSSTHRGLCVLLVLFRASYSPFVLTCICEWMSAFSVVPGTW